MREMSRPLEENHLTGTQRIVGGGDVLDGNDAVTRPQTIRVGTFDAR
jgi:hypothetical protein